MENYQIFISYRRDGGSDLAGRIADRLKQMGYSVFFDVESMRSGLFNTQILTAITNASDFLLILPPDGLERCSDPNDWVRQELAHALKQQKNIIPIMMRNFSFPQILPTDIEKIRYMEGISASTEYFDAVIDRITTLLKSKPGRTVTPSGTANSRIKIPLFLQVQKNTFLTRALKISERVNINYNNLELQKQYISSLSLTEYLARQKEVFESPAFKELNAVFNEKEETAAYEFLKEMYSDYNKTINKQIYILFSRFGIPANTTLLTMYVGFPHMISSYCDYLLSQKPRFYEVRLIELCWLFDEFDLPNLSLETWHILDKRFLDYMFRGSAYQWEIKEYYGDAYSNSKQRVKEYDILSEVSYSLSCLIENYSSLPLDQVVLDISLYLTAVMYLFSLTVPKPAMTKRVRKFMLMNYKFIQKNKPELLPHLEPSFETVFKALK
ncbi:MAG: toll/interleukin-1 receptor domain-containing protein [Clostridia bacterium]|nr:toll/interleukin-1 receptor domain-containing protein [Clostridia bacterium]